MKRLSFENVLNFKTLFVFLLMLLAVNITASADEIDFDYTISNDSVQDFKIGNNEILDSEIISFDISDSGNFGVDLFNGQINIYDHNFKFIKCIHIHDVPNGLSFIFWNNNNNIILYDVKSSKCIEFNLNGEIQNIYNVKSTIHNNKLLNELIKKKQEKFNGITYKMANKISANNYTTFIKQDSDETTILIDVRKSVAIHQILEYGPFSIAFIAACVWVIKKYKKYMKTNSKVL